MRAAKVDKNQPVVVAALRALGFKVQPTHVVGHGAPDFVVLGVTRHLPFDIYRLVWVELKCGRGRLTEDERKWHKEFETQYPPIVVIVWSVRAILMCFEWENKEINKALSTIQEQNLVKRALADARRKHGEIDDILESLL